MTGRSGCHGPTQTTGIGMTRISIIGLLCRAQPNGPLLRCHHGDVDVPNIFHECRHVGSAEASAATGKFHVNSLDGFEEITVLKGNIVYMCPLDTPHDKAQAGRIDAFKDHVCRFVRLGCLFVGVFFFIVIIIIIIP
eukprot:scaffold37_cov159-Amphora_coffeaeformis.AAC.3